MPDIILHPESRSQLDAFVSRPSHALRIVGPAGSGKLAFAQLLAGRLVNLAPERLGAYPYLLVLGPEDGKSIGIDSVRALENFVSRRIPGGQTIRRVVIIDPAHLLTPQAQNALLKTLEEPPEDTVMLLLSADDQALLPTIRSRTQRLSLQRPPIAELTAFFARQGHSAPDIQKAVGMSGGLPGLMHSLLSADDQHQLKQAADTVRQLLGAQAYERLLFVDDLSRKRALCEDICFLLMQLADLQLPGATGPAAKRWQHILESAYQAREALRHSAQPKLVMTNLLLNL